MIQLSDITENLYMQHKYFAINMKIDNNFKRAKRHSSHDSGAHGKDEQKKMDQP